MSRISSYFTKHSKNSKWILSYWQFTLRKRAHAMYRDFFSVAKKKENLIRNNLDIFLIFAQNINRGYTLKPPRRDGSNEYPQSMFWSKNKKNRYTPAYPSFAI